MIGTLLETLTDKAGGPAGVDAAAKLAGAVAGLGAAALVRRGAV